MLTTKQTQRTFRFYIVLLLLLLTIGLEGAASVMAQQPEQPARGSLRIPQEITRAVQQNGQAQVIISLREDANSPRKSQMAADKILELQNNVLADLAPRGFEMRRQYQGFPALAGTVNQNALQALERNPHISSVLPDFEIEKHGNNGRDVVGVISAHSSGFTGEGVTVAVIDTGIAPEAGTMYTGIADAVIGEACFTQQNCYPLDDFQGTSAQDGDGNPATADYTGHGTVVADIITGPEGYAPDSTIVAVRVLDDAGGGYLSDWLAGLDWVAAHYLDYGIDVVNMSLGTIFTFPEYEGPTDPWGNPQSGCEFDDPLNPGSNILADNDLVLDVADIIAELRINTIPVFVSSGNQGSHSQTPLPACLSGVISVAATYASDIGRFPTYPITYADLAPGFPACFDQVTSETTVACFSSGPADVAAPGVHTVDLAGGGTAVIAGTSYASPAAAGVAALMKQGATFLSTGFGGGSNPDLPNDVTAFINILQQTGTPTHYNYSSETTPSLINARNVIFGTDTSPGVLAECDIEVAAGDVYSANGLVNAINTAMGTGQLICLAPGSTYSLIAKIGNAGLPNITDYIEINGRGATIERASSAAAFRLFSVEADTPDTEALLVLHNTTLQNGSEATGGAILAQDGAQVWLDGVTLQNNVATSGSGGAVRLNGPDGYIYAIGSRFENNQATINGGGIHAAAGAHVYMISTIFRQNLAFNGAGIYHTSANTYLYLYGSSFQDNVASGDGGALYRANDAYFTYIDNTRFEHNIADGSGGAIFHGTGGHTSLSGYVFDSDFILNIATDGGGAFYGQDVNYRVMESNFINNTATASNGSNISYGGAFELNGAVLELFTSSIEGNSAVYGGAVFTSGSTLSVWGSTFTGNIAAVDVANGYGHVFNDRGGLADVAPNSVIDIVNSTFTINETAFFGNYMAVIGNSDFDLAYSTLVGNAPLYITGPNDGTGGDVRIKGSLVVDTVCSVSGGTLATFDRVYSETGNTSCNNDVDQTFSLDQLALGALADNGGATKTIEIGVSSAAVGRLTWYWYFDPFLGGYPVFSVPDCTLMDGSTPISYDQRELERDSLCDVGAFEYRLPEPKDDFQTVVTSGEVVHQFNEYRFRGATNDTDPADGQNEPQGCLGTPPGTGNDSQHLAVSGTSIFRGLSSGTSIFRGLSAGQSIFRGLASGSVFMEVSTLGSEYDSSVGVYKGSSLNQFDQNEQACLNGNGRMIFEISGNDAESEDPYRLILWKNDPNDPDDVYALEITDITYKGCGSVDGIPPLECEALVQLFYAADGERWGNSPRHYWLDTDRPCHPHALGGWQGLTCSNGRVVNVDLSGIPGVDLTGLQINGVQVTPTEYFNAKKTPEPGSGIVVTTTNMTPLVRVDGNLDPVADPSQWHLSAIAIQDGLCSLHEAIYLAHGRLIFGQNPPEGECALDPQAPAGRITLGSDRVYEMVAYDNYRWGNNGLPVIDTDIEIMGNGSRIERSTNDGTPEFRIFSVNSGHLTLDNVIVRNGSVAGFGDFGGGVHVIGSGGITSIDSQFLSNSALEGGGIHIESSSGPNEFYNTLFGANRAVGSGGAISSYVPITIAYSLITGNQAANLGGGVFLDRSYSAELTMYNTTISGNNSGLSGAGLAMGHPGLLAYVTFANNVTAPAGGALLADTNLELHAVLFADNTGGNCRNDGTSLGYNISDDGSCTFLTDPNDLNSISANIGLLTRIESDDNTLVHTLLPGSPALDRIPVAVCDVTDDQLGTERGTTETRTDCDVGAFEHINRPPVAQADQYQTDYNTLLAVSAANGVLSNDDDPDQDPILVVDAELIQAPANAREFEIQANGSFTYRPRVDFHGQTDSFSYMATDGSGVSDVVTVTIEVGPIPALPPENLSVVEAMGQPAIINNLLPPVFPTLRWTHRLTLQDTQIPGKWYHIVMNNSQGQEILNTWLDAKVYCSGLTCEVPLGEATTPNAQPILPDWGLVNGDYSFWVRAWYGPNSVSDWSAPGHFNMAIAKPSQPVLTIDTSTGRPLFDWAHDPYALFYQVRIRNSVGNEIHKKWYQVGEVCDDTGCSFYPPVHPVGGNYLGDVLAWGPGGLNDDGFSAAVGFSLTTQPPDQVVVDEVIPSFFDNGTLYVNTGEPTFVWSPTPRATWYNIVVVSIPTGLQYQAWLLGTDICNNMINGQLKCLATPPSFFLTNESWSWLVRAWGPGGFNNGDPNLWSQGNFTVNAPQATVPLTNAPEGTINTLIPVFSWDRVPYATWYRLEVWDGSTMIIGQWLRDDALGCYIHEGANIVPTCLYQVSPLLLSVNTPYQWRVQAWSPGGISDWSALRAFTIESTGG